jgi:hypothetical protein
MDTKRPSFDQAFFEALLGEDELGVVIRAHIHIEATLREFIEARLPMPDELPGLQYGQRVRLACALGLGAEHKAPLIAVGNLRNSFAHRLSKRLSQQDTRELYGALSIVDRQAVQEAYRNTNAAFGREDPPDFQQLEPKDQFVLIAVSLKAMLLVAAHHAQSSSLD